MLQTEPLVIRAAIVAAVNAAIRVAILLGAFPIGPEAEEAIRNAIDLVSVAVLVVWTRGKVVPVGKIDVPTAPAPEPVTVPEPVAELVTGPRHRA